MPAYKIDKDGNKIKVLLQEELDSNIPTPVENEKEEEPVVEEKKLSLIERLLLNNKGK